MSIHTEFVRTRVSPRILKQLQRIARKSEKSVSAITRELLINYVNLHNQQRKSAK